MSRPYAQLFRGVYAEAAGGAGAGQGVGSEAEELRRVAAIYREGGWLKRGPSWAMNPMPSS